MKRQAEKQLIKGDEEGEDDDSSSQGFRKADESVLAARTIRGLPKRAAATTSHAPPIFSTNTPAGSFKFESSPSTPATSLFSGFVLNKPSTTDVMKESSLAPSLNKQFGTPTSTSFTAPSTISAFPRVSQATSLPDMTTTPSTSLANSISTPSPNPFGTPRGPTSSSLGFGPLKGSTSNDSSNGSAPLKYYTDLRGLNASLIAAISKTVEADPFLDVSNFLEQYKSFRRKIQDDLDKSTTTAAAPTFTPSPSTSSIKSAMPAPPASFTGFDAFKSSSVSVPSTSSSISAPSKTNIFDLKSSSSGFNSSSATNPFALPLSKDSSPGNPFGAPTTSTSDASPSSTPFTFGGTATSSTTSPFGTFGSTPSSSTSFTLGNTSAATAPKSIFGSGSTTSSSFTFGSSASDKATSSSPASIFGNSDQKTIPSSSLFGSAAKDSAKNSVHFGFGSSSNTTGTAFGAASTLFETAKASTESVASTGGTSTEGETSDRATPTTEGGGGGESETTPAFFTHNPHDEEGEGEENEETIHKVKVKAYRLESGTKWVVLGSGLLRLKKHKESEARRVLLRNSINGKVIVNFSIYSGLKPAQTKSALSFVGHDAGVSQTYSVRLANEDDAKELKSALDREITFVKAKES